MTEPKILRVRQVRACELRLSVDSAAHRLGDVFELDEQLAKQLIKQGVVVEEPGEAPKAGRKRSQA